MICLPQLKHFLILSIYRFKSIQYRNSMNSPYKNRSNKKEKSADDHASISNLNPTEQTRKGMSAEQIIMEPVHVKSSLHGKASMHNYSLPLPVGIDVSVALQTLKQRIGSQVIYCNQQRGQMLVQGPRKTTFWHIIDILLCWKIEGSTKGTLAHCYNVYSIRISKQVIDKKCTITIKPSHPKLKDPYYMDLIKLIENEVKVMPHSPSLFHKVHSSFLEFDCPLHREITAFKAIEKFFSSGGDKRYRVLYQKSIGNIRDQIAKLQQEQSKYKRIDLVEATVNQSNSLYTSFTYDQPQNNTLHKQYCLYAIQSLVCNSILKEIHETYIQQTKDQCAIFNQQIILINDHMSNEQCWKYLECRGKYTLPSQKQPYFLSILALQELQWANSFRQMLLCVQKCFSEAKVACLIEHKGNLELSTMDDILPVMIYIVIRAGIKNFPSYVKMVDDYVRARGTFQLEQRVITSLFVAVEDVSKKWAMKDKGKQNIRGPELSPKQLKSTVTQQKQKSPNKSQLKKDMPKSLKKKESEQQQRQDSNIRESQSPLKISLPLPLKEGDQVSHQDTVDN